MRVAMFTAGSDIPLEKRGDLYEIACIVDASKSPKPPRNLNEREWSDRETAEFLQSLEIDYIFAAGYRYVLTEPILDAFPNRIIVVQNGDLTERDEYGRRRWVGTHPVIDALLAGATSTRTSLYFATNDVGHGPLFLVGPRYAVPAIVQHALARGDYDLVATYAHLHNRWMQQAWGELLLHAIEVLSAGTMTVVGDMVWVDGVPGPCRLAEAPDVCHQSERRVQRGIPSSCPFIQS
jgi:folate-dependent phosphoribosylglycinamide formyltransferase PurN